MPHLVASAVPGLRLTVIDTGYLFAETDWFIDHLVNTYDLDVDVIRPNPKLERDLWRDDPEACCAARKVEPLERALADKRA